MRKTILKIISILFLTFSNQLGLAQDMQEAPGWAVFLEDPTPLKRGENIEPTDYYLIKIVNQVSLRVIDEMGFSLVRKLDSITAIFRYSNYEEQKSEFADLQLWRVNNHWKLSGNLLGRQLNDQQEEYLVKSINSVDLMVSLREKGISSKRISPQLIRLQASSRFIHTDLLNRSDVLYIGKESSKVVLESRVIDMNLNPNRVNRIHHDYPELNGEGMVLSIREGMFDVSDMDLRTRHLSSVLEGIEPTSHATEMATIAAGAGNSSLNGLGVATSAKLTGSLLEEFVPDADEDYLRLNAHVQNHSYGTSEIENFYGGFAEAYDQSANNNPHLLHVFSAGNLGVQAPESGVYMGALPVANMTGNFKMSKNTLAVASVDTVGREVSFVSRGPAHDGRIKPELVAYSMAGSSNSAAMVSGVSVILQQAYQETHGRLPASALVKALLINSAVDVGNVGPDYTLGYGNVDAYRSLQNLKANRFFSSSITQGESKAFDLTIPANAINLKVSLVWNDPAALANANVALVNDLDLSVIDVDDTAFNPWVLNPNIDRLDELASRGFDRLNNVEQVSIETPTAGTMSVKISAFDIPEGVQEFYVAYQWDEQSMFDWSFPTGSDNMPYNGETTSYFRWKSTLVETVGQLEYSIDNGITWELINDEVALSRGYFRWDAPQIRSAAIARMVVGAQSFSTDVFTISRPARVAVGFSCADSVRLQWNTVPEAEAYEVLTFGGAFLEPITQVTDTSFTFRKSNFSTSLFTVQPVLTDGTRAIQAPTFDYNFQGVGCYLISFFTQAEAEEGVRVNINLGTTAGVSDVTIERQVSRGGFEPLTLISGDALTSDLSFLDEQPFQGLNEYQAHIRFQNGEELSTEVSSVYFLTTEPFLVFPNPIPRGDRLNIFSKTFENNPEVTFMLYDHAGLPIFERALNSERVSFGMERLQAGVYFYRIITNGYSHKGRIILE